MTAPVVETSPIKPSKPGVFSGKVDPSMVPPSNIKVAIRIRPIEPHHEPGAHEEEEKKNGDSHPKKKKNKPTDKRAWTLHHVGATNTLAQKGTARKVEGKTLFHFDQIFDEDTLTPLLHQSITRPMVKNVLSGQHATVFAYGQTGSGKTFTMQGDGKKHGGQAGVIQLVASDLFRFMRQGANSKRDFTIKVSYVEVYNEKIRDLLSSDGCGSTLSHGTPEGNVDPGKGEPLAEVTIRTTATGQIVLNAQQTEAHSVDQVLELLTEGNANRMVAKTDMNNHSSRSHAIFRLTVESRSKEGNNDENDVLRLSDFNLVDLAGSESVKLASTASGIRQREGAKINQSLLSLSTVIHSLSLPPKKRPRHINYRDSKVTRILQPHLQGNAEMAILCCISPSKAFVEESRTTLRFAARAKLVEMTPKVNEILDDFAKIKKLQTELDEAREEIAQLKKALAGPGPFRGPAPLVPPPAPDYNRANSAASSTGGPARKYVMPSNQPIPQDADLGGNALARDYLKSHMDDSPDSRLGDSANFKLDAIDPTRAERTVFRYMAGDVDTDDSANLYSDGSAEEISGISEMNSFDMPLHGKQGLLDQYGTPDKAHTARTEMESMDGPEGSYHEVSLKLGSVVSSPDSLRMGTMSEQQSNYAANFAVRGKGKNNLSWDSELDTLRPEQRGRPLQAMRSLTAREGPIPTDITIISTFNPGQGVGACLTDRVEEAEKRAEFFELRLEDSDDLIEALFKDLERARLCIHDMVFRNVKLAAKLKEKRREDLKEEYQEGEVIMEQYWLLKGAMYMGLFFFFVGGYEYFMATVIMIWLILETNIATATSTSISTPAFVVK